MIIIYQNETEVLVTTSKREKKFKKEWFVNGARSEVDYNRIEVADCGVQILNKMTVFTG